MESVAKKKNIKILIIIVALQLWKFLAQSVLVGMFRWPFLSSTVVTIQCPQVASEMSAQSLQVTSEYDCNSIKQNVHSFLS